MKAPTLNPVLTGIATRFLAAMPTAGSRIAPILNTPDASAQYYIYNTSNFTDVPIDIERAPSSPFKRLTSKLSSDAFIARDRGIEEPMDKAQIRMFASIFAADKSAMERCINVVAITHEIRVRNIVRASAQTATPAVKWGAATNTTIVADLEAAKAVIRAATGVIPNLLTLPYDVWVKLRQAPELKAYYSYTQGGLLTIDNLKAVLGFADIVVSGTIINGANEGQTPALADIWTNEAFLSYSNPSADVKALNFARTFNWTAMEGSGPNGISTFTYDQNEIDSRIVRARQFTDEKVIAPGAGYYLSNVLS